jgi:hypothetical protein
MNEKGAVVNHHCLEAVPALKHPTARKRRAPPFNKASQNGREKMGMGDAHKNAERRANPQVSDTITKKGIFT